ncbi:MAG TPA: CehA/McbA family metallohydrolase [Candidatus Dormibacteraeota bacterium]|jgi:predicted metal-dependent phosphoesterase TrpH
MPARGLADLHLHTSFSDGWPSPAEVVDHVTLETNLDVIAITDHDTIEGALRAVEHSARTAGVPVIIGEEVSSRQGHILGLFLERRVRPGLSAAATVDEIHNQGGIAIAAHPFWRTERMAERLGGPVHGIGWLAADLDFDAVEVENSTPGLGFANILARRLADGAGCTCVGSSDAHILEAIGKSATAFKGRSPRALRSAIEKGTTVPVSSRYEVSALLRYLAWSLNHERVVTVLEQVSS